MWTYSQSKGLIQQDGRLQGAGYSGHGPGLNAPDQEAVPNVGPIPRGHWQIVRWDDHHGNKGPCVAVLAPVGHDAHGRSAFLIHGPHANDHMDSSDGCIVTGPLIRQDWRASNDMDLEVIV